MSFISKKEAEKLMAIDGEVRGIGIKDDFLYVKKIKGKEVMDRMEKSIQDLGYDFHLDRMKALAFYPVGFEGLGLVASHKIAGFTPDDIREMGAYEPKASLIIRLFMKYFVSIDMVAKKASEMWESYYTRGELVVLEMDKENKRGEVVLKDFKLHPFHCRILEGYFATLLQTVTKEKVTCREIECPFEGGQFHKFVLTY